MLFGLASFVFLLSWWTTRYLSQEAFGRLFLDYPNERSLHRKPTPRTGGLAIVGSFLVGAAIVVWGGHLLIDPTNLPVPFVWRWIVLGMTFVAVISFFDDWRGVSVWIRVSAHLIAASGVVLGGGLTLSAIPTHFAGVVELGWWAQPVAILFLAWMANLYNFMDGIDGFAGGMTVIGGSFLAVFAGLSGQQFFLWMGVLGVVSAGGFLVWNFPPARIFMGDVGSVPLGFLCGSLILVGCTEKVFDIWVPVMIFSPFIVDATLTLGARVLGGNRPWEAHRFHYYQRLVLCGFSHKKTVLLEYGLMLACGGLAALYSCLVETDGGAVVFASWLFLWCCCIFLVRWIEKGHWNV